MFFIDGFTSIADTLQSRLPAGILYLNWTSIQLFKVMCRRIQIIIVLFRSQITWNSVKFVKETWCKVLQRKNKYKFLKFVISYFRIREIWIWGFREQFKFPVILFGIRSKAFDFQTNLAQNLMLAFSCPISQFVQTALLKIQCSQEQLYQMYCWMRFRAEDYFVFKQLWHCQL